MSRYVVLGAGAIGGTVGGRLVQAGHDVLFIARGAHGEALRRAGLLLRDPDADARLRVSCVPHPSDVGWRTDDVVLLATKTQDAGAALDALALAAPPSIAVVCATNGLEGERLAARRFEHVYALTVMLPAAHLHPGQVVTYCAPVTGVLDIGRYPRGVDERAEQIAADLAGATFLSEAQAEPLRAKRRKLLLNLANVIEAAVGPEWYVGAAEVYAAARAEAEACFDAAGLDTTTDEEEKARRGDVFRLREVGGEKRSGGSTWQSVARGAGSTEVDYLNGEIVLLGRLHGVPTPVNAALQRLGHALVTDGIPAGSLSTEELTARLALDP